MPRLTRAAFGALVGANEGVIRRAIKNGRIAVEADGLIDSETQVARWEGTRDHARVHSGQRADAAPKVRGRKPTATGAKASKAAEVRAADGFLLKAQKTAIEIELLREELSQTRKDTIARDDVRRGLASFAKLQSAKWLNFPNRFGPLIAADAGCDAKALMAVLDRYVREQLTEIANISPPVS